VGFIAAFVVAFFTVRAVLALIGRIGFTPFGYYRIALGALMLVVLALS
jgi:undecaprenyl-diphosphatase